MQTLHTINKKQAHQRRDQVLTFLLNSDFSHTLRKQQLEQLIKRLSKEKKRRYHKRNHSFKKYGNLNKGFTQYELDKFFQESKQKKATFAFKLMAYLGLRIGEVVNIKLEDVDLQRRRILIHTEKGGPIDSLPLHDAVYNLLKEWVTEHRVTMQLTQGYLLFAESTASTSSHISENWLRNEFRRIALRAGLNDTYDTSDETTDKMSRRLFRLTTHSFRHYFINRIYRSTKDPVVAQKLARHEKFSSTQIYINNNQELLDQAMQLSFC